jgi:hypothetical protein
MRFEQYFSTEEICQRIPRSAKFIRAEILRGGFSPGRTPAGEPDLGNIQVIDGAYMVPLSGILHYLSQHALPHVQAAAELVADRLRPPTVDRDNLPGPGIAARSPGELRRKLQTFGQGQEAVNG